MPESLHEQGRPELVRAFADGTLPIQRLEEAFEARRIHELTAELQEGPDMAVEDACAAALRAKAPDVKTSTATGLEHFQAFARHDDCQRGADARCRPGGIGW